MNMIINNHSSLHNFRDGIPNLLCLLINENVYSIVISGNIYLMWLCKVFFCLQVNNEKDILINNMFTKDDLEQIGKLLDSRLQAEREHTKKIVQDEREHTKKIVQAAKEEIMKTIEKETETISGFFHATWEKYDNHEKRIEQLEENQLSTHKN